MKKAMVIVVVTLLFMCMYRVNGNEKFLTGALDEDKAMQELSARVAEIKDKQEESNVFSKGEIKNSSDTIERIDQVRDENIGSAINNLEKTVEEKKKEEDVGQYYDNARNEYEKAVLKMNVIYDKQVKGLMDKKGNQELYEKQKQLLEELKEFQEEMNKKDNKAGEDDLDKVAEMSEKQEELKQDTEDKNLQKKMDQANEDLKNMEFPEAIKKQQEIVDEMKKDVDADSPESDESQGSNMDEMEKKMSEMEKKLEENLKDDSQGLSDEERQEMAMAMSEMAEQMKQEGGEQGEAQEPPTPGGEAGQPEPPKPGGEAGKTPPPTPGGAAEQMEQAMMNILQQQDQQALQALQAAQQVVQQMAAATPKPPGPPGPPDPNAPPGMDSVGESKAKENGPLYGKTNKEADDSDWKAALPAKERAALLAAQKAKYSADMELSVRKYFKELAK